MDFTSVGLKILLCIGVVFLAGYALADTPISESSEWEWKGTLSMASCLNTSPFSLRYYSPSETSDDFSVKSQRIILAPGLRIISPLSRKNFFFMEIPLSYFSGERRQDMANDTTSPLIEQGYLGIGFGGGFGFEVMRDLKLIMGLSYEQLMVNIDGRETFFTPKTNAQFGIELAASSHLGLSVFLELSALDGENQVIWYGDVSFPPELTIRPQKESSFGIKGTLIF